VTISLGAIFGGSERTTAQEVFRSMSIAFADQRLVEKPFLNVVFHFPGSILKPEHSGLRTGRFSKKEQGFQIQAAVPESIAKSDDALQISTYLLQAVREALVLSEPRWAKHRITFDFVHAKQAIHAIAAQFGLASVT